MMRANHRFEIESAPYSTPTEYLWFYKLILVPTEFRHSLEQQQQQKTQNKSVAS